ncbi:hypothetical protein [Zavarzinella formosa]|uniref:hypothetical protein n=1 Tax=Zavarzinella formosa TaxID=360055 RepID=UPI000308511F|nr:hypothetical protein [Zavarzinella formosa]
MARRLRNNRPAFRLAAGALALVFGGLLVGCSGVGKPDQIITPAGNVAQPALPGKSPPQRVSQFVFYSDTPLKENTPLFQELSTLRDQMYRELQLPPSNSVVQVYLFDNQDRYEKYMQFRYPELPRRRAFFIAQPRTVGGPEDLTVYTFWGDHIRQDLRHELTHALLHSVLKEVPLWLDEGLAEFYESPPEKSGYNAAHAESLRQNGFAPDLVRLEKLDQVQQMGRPQYQESWAWVHLMLRGTPEARVVLLEYLQQLRGPAKAGLLAPKLRKVFPNPGDALSQHLAKLDPPSATLRPVVELTPGR